MRGQGGERGRRRYTDTRKTPPRPPTGTAGEVNHDILEAKGRGSSEKTSPPRWWPPSGTREAGEKDEAAPDAPDPAGGLCLLDSGREPGGTRLTRRGSAFAGDPAGGGPLSDRARRQRRRRRRNPARAISVPKERSKSPIILGEEVPRPQWGKNTCQVLRWNLLHFTGEGRWGRIISFSASPGRMGLPAPRPSVAV